MHSSSPSACPPPQHLHTQAPILDKSLNSGCAIQRRCIKYTFCVSNVTKISHRSTVLAKYKHPWMLKHQTVGCFVHRQTKTGGRNVTESWEQQGLYSSRLELVFTCLGSHTPRHVGSGCGMIAVDWTAALLPVCTALVRAATSHSQYLEQLPGNCRVIQICNHSWQFTTSWFIQGVSRIHVVDYHPIPGPTLLPTWKIFHDVSHRRSQWPCGLRRRSAAESLLRSGFESHQGHGCLSHVSVCVVR
jgi:hypothetical protein